MVMNFYKQQEEARRQEKIMLLLFVLMSVILTILLTKAIDWGYAFISNRTKEIPDELSLLELLLINILFFSSICTASFYKIKQLSKGDYSSIMMGGVLLDDDPNNLRAVQLRNTVEEMAIAAGIPVPKIYVLKNEPSVNAFAAGIRHTDMVVGITRGSLEYLNRDELQGVAAYQMAQIINGYARLNTLMYGVLFGLQSIYITMTEFFKSVYEVYDTNDEGAVAYYWLILLFPLWFPLWLISYLGHFFAKIIKSIICRENVFQIDATAVQLSRNPNGLASVLQKSLQTKWSYILFADTFLLDLEHLLLTFGKNPIYEFQILHTHPDTEQRIKKILPHWRGTPIATEDDAPRPTQQSPFYNQTAVKNILGSSDRGFRKIAKEDELKIIPTIAQNHEVAYDAAATAAALGIIGGINEVALQAVSLENEAYWFAAARQPEKASAVVVAMLARHSDNKKACLDIAELFSQELHNNIKQLLEHALPDEKRFAVLAIALPNLRLNIIGEENINKYKHFLQEVIKSDDKITLFEHCVYAAVSGSLKMSLMAGFLPPVGKDKLKSEIIELLNLTAQHSNSGHHAKQAFQAALTECGFAQTAYRDNIPLGRLSSLLHTLDRLSAADKQQILTALENIAHFDEVLSESEKDWLSAIAIAWEMPVSGV